MFVNVLVPILILGVLGLIFGVLLGFAAKKFAVKQDERIPKLRGCLPGANCGGCGYVGCDAYARAIVEDSAPLDACPVGGAPVSAQLAQVMGVEVTQKEKMVAFVQCSGTFDVAYQKLAYSGIKSCIEASVIPGKGPKSCEYGCLGFGCCVDVCQFDAVHVTNGIAKVDESKCVGCGACVSACPKHVIRLIPQSQRVRVACSGQDRGRDVKALCQAGCLGCTLCVKTCPSGAIAMEGNVARIDASLCTQCGLCMEKCPSKVIARL